MCENKWKNNPKRPLTLRELEAELENITDNEIDVAIIPPTGDDLTDEEYFDDNDLTGNFRKIIF